MNLNYLSSATLLRKRDLLARIGRNVCKKHSIEHIENRGNYSSRKFPESDCTTTQQTETLTRPNILIENRYNPSFVSSGSSEFFIKELRECRPFFDGRFLLRQRLHSRHDGRYYTHKKYESRWNNCGTCAWGVFYFGNGTPWWDLRKFNKNSARNPDGPSLKKRSGRFVH